MASPTTSSPSPPASPRLRLFPIVTLALFLRLSIVFLTLRSHSPQWFFDQASELGCLAQSLLSGRGFASPFCGDTGPSAFLAPGYPFLVAVIFKLFGSYTFASETVIMLLQALFGAATVLLLMRLTHRLFGAPAANVAGAIWALSPPLLFLPIVFWETSLSTLLLTALLALALTCATSPSVQIWLVLGACFLLTLAINPTLLTAIVCCAVWAAFYTRPSARRGLWLTLVLSLAVFSLWPLRNYRALHAFIPLRSNMGYELWQGNRPGATGFFTKTLHPNLNPQEFRHYQQLGELPYMREKGDLAKAAIAANKPRFLALTLKRIGSFWTGAGPQSSGMMVLYASVSSALGLTGLILLCRRNRKVALLFLGPLLFFPLPYYLTHPDFRFRSVLDPLLIALAAYALTQGTNSQLAARGSQLDRDPS